ncbi:MAG: cytochrome c [Gammaproteobacteria bacterium]|nr:cytochrome c [Gammaproteobacteria bacterium]
MPTKLLAILFPALLMASGGTSAVPPEFNHGRTLHNANCTTCHGNMTGGDGITLYTRSPRMVNSTPQLKKRVRYCASGAQLNWSGQDIADVVLYLDRQFYNFSR